MKRLFLIRHAKSSWKHHELEDFDRPLNGRGKRDAPFMGQWLRDQGVKPDLIVSSPAVRALTTARKMAQELGYPLGQIREDHRIYEASTGTLLRVVRELPEHADIALLFGHNPGFTWLANDLTGEDLENVPTAGIVHVNFELKTWSEVDKGTGRMISFDFPKKYR